MSALLLYLTLFTLAVLTWALLALRKIHRFFDVRGIKHFKPFLMFGNLFQSILLKKGQIDVLEELYRTYPDEKLTGFFNFTTPYIVIQCADYVESVTIKYFSHFSHRGFHLMMDKTQNPFDESLLTIAGKNWKPWRQKLSQIFSPGMLNSMVPSMETCSNELVEYLEKNPKSRIDLKKVAELFTFDSIGASIFGIKSQVYACPNSDYARQGRRALELNRMDLFIFVLINILPTFLVRLLGLSINKHESMNYFGRILSDAFNFRSNSKTQRKDLVQLLLQLKHKKKIDIYHVNREDEDASTKEKSLGEPDVIEITDQLIMTHAFSFLTGGNDTQSLSIFYTCFELARHPEIQEKVRDEIREKINLHGGLNLGCTKELVLLENCIKEALRLYPPFPSIVRFCTKDYTFPNGYIIRKGEFMQIPIRSIHRNPNYHEDPHLFKPERFDKPMKPGTFLAFGSGPRICIAQRYAMFNCKIALSTILLKYRLRLHSKLELPMKFKPISLFMSPRDEILFDLEEIEP